MSTPIRNIVKKTLSPRLFKSPTSTFLNSPRTSLLSEVTSPCKLNTSLIPHSNKFDSVQFNHEDVELCRGDKLEDFIIRKPNKNKSFNWEKCSKDEQNSSFLEVPKEKDIPSVNTPERDDLLKCDLSRLNLNVFGKGSFGTVVQAKYKGKDVALKIIHQQNPSFLLEANALNLNHPNILPVLLLVNNADHHLVVMPQCIARDMHGVLDDRDINIPLQIYVQWVLEVCSALEYCHKRRILHLDVKPKNILIQDNRCLLCDFGNSLDLNNDVQKCDYVKKLLDGHGGSTVVYSAPELLHGNTLPTSAADVYALGVTMYQIQTRCHPYYQMDNTHIILYQVVKYNLRPKTPEEYNSVTSGCGCTTKFRLLYKSCWHQEPNKRLLVPSLVDSLEEVMFQHKLHVASNSF